MASDWIRRNSRRRIILLDTSAIFMIFENSIRIEDELNRLLGSYDIKIIQEIFNEINLLKEKGSGKQKLLAKYNKGGFSRSLSGVGMNSSIA